MKKTLLILVTVGLFNGCMLRHPLFHGHHGGGGHYKDNRNSNSNSRSHRNDNYQNRSNSRMNVERYNERR